jgi:hypothetical protein
MGFLSNQVRKKYRQTSTDYSWARSGDVGPPGLPHNHDVRYAMASDPEEVNVPLPLSVGYTHINFRQPKSVVLPNFKSYEAHSLQPSGLRAACLLSYT